MICTTRTLDDERPARAHQDPSGISSRATVDPDLLVLHRELHRQARRIVRSDDLAWDVVQETLVRDHLRNPERRSPLPALRKLCSLIALSLLRARARREHHETASCSAVSHHLPGDDPSAVVQNAELSALLAEALRSLPADHREVVELFELQGHSYACIAEQLDVPIGTVRSRLARARAGLRDVLGRTAVAYTEELAS